MLYALLVVLVVVDGFGMWLLLWWLDALLCLLRHPTHCRANEAFLEFDVVQQVFPYTMLCCP